MWRCTDYDEENERYAILVTDRNGTIEYVNSDFEERTGFSAVEVVGRNVNLLKSGRHDAAFYKRLWATLGRGDVFRDVFVNKCKNGHVYYEPTTISPITDRDGNISHYLQVSRHAMPAIEEYEGFSTLVHYDPLTGLPNRVLFHERLQRAIARSQRTGNPFAVLFLDLDEFKPINDSHGHAVGDRLLLAAGQRLRSCLRDSDTIARLGGDEFTAILEDIADAHQPATVAHKIVAAFRETFHVEGHALQCTCSLGVALFPHDADSADGLAQAADRAMYLAKQTGRDNYQFHSRELNERHVRHKRLTEKLRESETRNEFHLCYQPLIDADSGRMVAAEALIRWKRPEAGFESPQDFFPVLDAAGLGLRIGEWVLRTACRQAARWRQPGWPALRIGVNVSARQFWHKDLTDVCARVLAESGVAPDRLCLEIPETVLMQDERKSAEILVRLERLGLRLCVDGFARVCTSLPYLTRQPFHLLKIDREFVQGIGTGKDAKRIAASVIALAHNLGIEVVGLGIASLAQLKFLLDHDCDVLQGYFFSEPVPETNTGLFGKADWRHKNFLASLS